MYACSENWETQPHVLSSCDIWLTWSIQLLFSHTECQLSGDIRSCRTICKNPYWLLTSCLFLYLQFQVIVLCWSTALIFFHFTVFRKKLHWMSLSKRTAWLIRNIHSIFFLIWNHVFDSVLSFFFLICVLDSAFT